MSETHPDRFVPSADPVAAWKAWTEYLAPLFDAWPLPETHVGASVAMRSYNLGSVLVGEVSAPAQILERSPRMAAGQGIDHVLVQLYRSGTSTVRTEGGETAVGPSDFVIYDLAQPVRIASSAVSATSIMLPRTALVEQNKAVHALHGCVFAAARDAAAQIFASYLRDVVAHGDDIGPQYRTGIAEAAVKLCSAALPNPTADASATEHGANIAIRAFIQTHLGSPQLGPEMIGARFGLSRATLYRQFAADDGVQNYIRNRRLARAMTLLTQTGGGPRPRVSSIAYAVGFTDEKTFSRAFKRRFGFLPREASADRAVPPCAGTGSALGTWIRHLAA